jgi:hypothetical protein
MLLARSIVISCALISSAAFAQYELPKFKSLDEFSRCARESYSGETCLEGLKAFAKKNPMLGFQAGKLARLNYTHWVALDFFEPALGKKPSAEQCKDEDVSMAVVSGLALPPEYPGFATAQRVASGPCAATLKPALDKALLAENPGSYYYNNVCAWYAKAGNAPAHCTPPVATPAPAAAPEKLPTLNLASSKLGLIKVYSGPEGEQISIAEITDKPGYVWVRLQGIRGKYNNKTMLHKEDLRGTRLEYWTEIDGKRWNTVMGSKTASGADLSSFLPGQSSSTEIRLYYNGDASKAMTAAQMKQ